MEYESRFCEIYVTQTFVALLIENCPVDQRHLIQTIGIEYYQEEDCYRVFLGGDELLAYAKAPYAKYTNEPRKDGKILHYRVGRYQGQVLTGWIDRTIEQLETLLQ